MLQFANQNQAALPIHDSFIMQEGRSSPVYNGGNFSPIMDNPTHEFHKWIATNLILK